MVVYVLKIILIGIWQCKPIFLKYMLPGHVPIYD